MTLSNHFFKRILLYSILIFSVQQCSYSRANELANVVAQEAVKSGFETIAENSVAAAPYISVVVQVYSIVQEIKSHNFPNEEEKIRAYQVAKQYALLMAENELEKCLIKNKDTFDRMSSGLPSECKEIVNMLLMYGGKKEVTRMTANYNQYRK
jgi:hypothetical protein